MIKINLLPQEMAGAGGGRASSAGTGSTLVAAVLLLVFGINAVTAGTLFYMNQVAQRERAEAMALEKKSSDELKTKQVKFDEVSLSLDRMQKLIAVAESLDPPERLLWSRKLNALPMLIPQGVFLTNIGVDQRIQERETEASVKARNEWNKTRRGTMPDVKKEFVINQVLNLTGLAYIENGSETQRLEQVTTFSRNLGEKAVKLPFDKEPSKFLEGFIPVITPSSLVAGTTEEGRDVLNFRFTIVTKNTTVQ